MSENISEAKFNQQVSVTPLWNDEITLNGLAQKRTTDFYNLEAKPM